MKKEFSMKKKTILDEKNNFGWKVYRSKTLYNLYFITSIEITSIKDSY